MAFATLEQIKPFIHNALYEKLNANTQQLFHAISAEIDTFIRDKTGIPIGTTLDWIIFPYSLLVRKFSLSLLSGVTQEYLDSAEKDFETAKKILAEHPVLNASGEEIVPNNSNSIVGSINDIPEW